MVRIDRQEKGAPGISKIPGLMRLTSSETQQSPKKGLVRAGDLYTHTDAEREKIVCQAVAEIGQIIDGYKGNFYTIARELEQKRIEAELQKMGAKDVIDRYHINVGRLTDGDSRERDNLQGALTWVKSATKPMLYKPLLFAGDILSKRVEILVDKMLAERAYVMEDTADTREGQQVPFKMRYRVRTGISQTGRNYRMMVPEEYLQDPGYITNYVRDKREDTYNAGYVIGFNKYGEIDRISDRYIHIGGECVNCSSFRTKRDLDYSGEIHGSNGIQTRKFIKENVDGEVFRKASFIFEWNRLLTDPTLSIITRAPYVQYFNFLQSDIFTLDSKGNEGKSTFFLSKDSTGKGYFNKNPGLEQVLAMVQDSLQNLPLIPFTA